MLPIKKIYIDTRLKSPDSKSNSDFSVDLPNTLVMPDNTVFYIDDVTIPVSWYNVDDNNNNLYAQFQLPLAQVVNRKIEIPVGNYSLATLAEVLQNQINITLQAINHPELSVSAIAIPSSLGINIKAQQSNWIFNVWTDRQLELYRPEFLKPYQSINSVLNHTEPQNGISLTFSPIDLHSVRNVYIHSPNLTTYSTMSLSGARDIIKKVPVNANYNEMIFNNVMVAQDYLDCSRQTLSRLSFSLQDVFGNTMDLRGNHWSFSIIFAKFDTEL